MLKTLRITSQVVSALAVCGVLFMFFFGLRGDSDIQAYLQNPGIIEQFQAQASKGDDKEPESPLVAQAHEFALRIDPPPPPPLPSEEPKVNPDVIRVADTQEPPRPKGPVSAKFELLATVQCEQKPTRSMVLLKEATGKEEWFWLGEKVGHLTIDEVRNGSAIFSQDGRNPQELFVPAKPQVPSLLKSEAITSAALPERPGSIDVQLEEGIPSASPVSGQVSSQPAGVVPAAAPAAIAESSPRNRRLRSAAPANPVASAAAESSSVAPIPQQPARIMPKQPTPEEKKAAIEKSIQSIQKAMLHQDSNSADSKQREDATKAWRRLIKSLEEEKQNLESAAKSEEKSTEQPPSKDNRKTESRVPDNDPNQE